ncbi:DUF2125 domain-containing protein [Antarctobacter heliothermus]|uniref:DUF2125 domain-containing protein n=1 Tax=Antarctobacter heliothermus TaxID=74033 RepID=A0A239BHR1_9RHOB|nr:DUF2125 domain-containing protein [Antarctobacter heliothermus]SNS07219.1 hypothetical protein SAMN04488078_1003121 [Antarctobacter heliothermus]
MTRLIFVVASVLLIGWAGLWVVSSWSLKRDIESWFDDRRAEGWQAEYTDLSVRGFPSRLDTTLTGVRLQDAARGVGWDAPFFQILGLTYRPGHLILVWPETQTLTLSSGPVRIASTGLRASLIHGAEGQILRANLEAGALTIGGPQGALAFDGLRAAVTSIPGAPDLYRIGLTTDTLATPDDTPVPGNAKADGLQLQAEVRFDQDWTLDALSGPRPQPQQIDLRKADYRLEGLELILAGQLTADARGRASGKVTVHAVNARNTLDHARDAQQLPKGLIDTLETALSLASGLKGTSNTLDLSLDFTEGRVSFGLIPLGEAPRLRLP